MAMIDALTAARRLLVDSGEEFNRRAEKIENGDKTMQLRKMAALCTVTASAVSLIELEYERLEKMEGDQVA